MSQLINTIMNIPNLIQAKEYIKIVDANKREIAQKSILYNLFGKCFPYNKSLEDVLIKVAEHIIKVNNIDTRLKDADLSLIDEIADVRFKDITRRLYSFATKYCHFHQPNIYPIYDKNVDEALWYFSKIGYIKQVFKRNDLKDYRTFKEIINNFRDFNKLSDLKYAELDKYLWKFGKDLNIKKIIKDETI